MILSSAVREREIDLPLPSHRLCARIARLYYESEMTQEQIGEALGISRMKVNRMLSLARRTGVVRFCVTGPDEPYAALQHELLTAYRLRDVRVTATPPARASLRSSLAAGAAAWLLEQLRPGLMLGVGLGRTVALIPETFRTARPVACTFVTVEGVGASPRAVFADYNVTSRLADAAGATSEIITAPTFVSEPATRDLLLAEPAVRASLDRARRADLVIQSVGTVDRDALLYRHGTLSDLDLVRLREAGAVGDALGHFFDADGRHVPWPTDDVHIGLTLEELRRLPTSALVAGGREKARVIRAALRGGYFNVLITDADTARLLLEGGL